MSKALTLDDILSSNDLTVEKVETPAWGGHVFVRSITGDKRDEFDSMFSGENVSLIGVRARLVGLCLCDEKGKGLNPTDNQLKALGKKSAAVLDRLFEVCQRLNGMRPDDVEKLEKNLPVAAGNGSG